MDSIAKPKGCDGMNSFKGWFWVSTVAAGMFFTGCFVLVAIGLAIY